MPGSPISSRTNSGRYSLAASMASPPQWTTFTSWPTSPRSFAIDQAVSASSSTMRILPPLATGRVGPPAGGYTRRACVAAGSRTMNSLPRPGPSLPKDYYAVADYYSEGQETVGRWFGGLAEGWGLTGTVTREAF